jgi:multidrug efflux pump subunit AcrA (membrane-fusion protein)
VRLHVQPGQAVDAGQPLFEVADYVGALVRVPLAGDVNRVAREKPVRILPINAKDAKTPAGGWTAQATQAPQGTDPKEAANALYYVVEEAGPELAPGQRVRAEFQLAGSAKQRLTVPYAAVIYDPRGEAWVYTNPEPLVFVRHRINVDYIEDGLAVLSDGPVAGTPVVMTGASELFGTEYKLGY